MRDMTNVRQVVADYCFIDDEDSFPYSEVIVWYEMEYQIPREDILTLVGSQMISSRVLDCWSLLMNQVQKSKDSPPYRLFFSLVHMDPLFDMMNEDSDLEIIEGAKKEIIMAWTLWLQKNESYVDVAQAKLIFLSIFHDEHYSLVVINFLNGTIEYLDNLIHKDWSIYYNICLELAQHMSRFLDEQAHPKAEELKSYSINCLQLKWRTKPTNVDCGVYTMLHMKMYEGDLSTFNLDVRRPQKRNYYRAEICASLVLADINDVRPEIMEKVCVLSQKRDDIKVELRNKWNKEAAERKKKEDEDKKKKKEQEDKKKKTMKQQKKKEIEAKEGD